MTEQTEVKQDNTPTMFKPAIREIALKYAVGTAPQMSPESQLDRAQKYYDFLVKE